MKEIGKNKVLLITAISVLLLAVAGATYAFFTAGSSQTGTANFAVTAEDGQSIFTALFNQNDISFDIKLTEMKENDNNADWRLFSGCL